MRRCEICGEAGAVTLLTSERLDGPLVRCPRCGLVYVGERRRDFTFTATDPARTQALGELVDELGIVARDVEEAEAPRRLEAERERLAHLQRHLASGRLLDVGSALGSFLAAAEEAGFDAEGVEPDLGTAQRARTRGLRVRTGTLADASTAPEAAGRFDALTLFHVIEHLDSPSAALRQARCLLREGGVLVVETPTVDNLWFRLAPGRWRQLIPDHYWFFSRVTLERLLSQNGFRPVEHRTVGRRVTLRFAADRLRRAGVPGAGAAGRALGAAGLAQHALYLNPGDIMRVVARARP